MNADTRFDCWAKAVMSSPAGRICVLTPARAERGPEFFQARLGRTAPRGGLHQQDREIGVHQDRDSEIPTFRPRRNAAPSLRSAISGR
jgi:hypothetical protein